jgi:hypothetical protein
MNLAVLGCHFQQPAKMDLARMVAMRPAVESTFT